MFFLYRAMDKQWQYKVCFCKHKVYKLSFPTHVSLIVVDVYCLL